MFGRKVINVRCINCSYMYNNVAKGIRLLDKKNIFLFLQETFHASKSFLKIYPLKETKSATMNIFRFFFIFFLNHL